MTEQQSPLKTPLEMFLHWEKTQPEQRYLRQSTEAGWVDYTWGEFGQRVRSTAAFLNAQGFEPGSRIAIISSNSADWLVVDVAIMLSGHISVPLYPGQDVETGSYILGHSGAQLVFVGEFDQAARADELLGTTLPRVAMRNCVVECQHKLEDIIANYEPYAESPNRSLDTVFTIVYTSGTTGNPKGVVHTFRAPAVAIGSLMDVLISTEEGERERCFSFLPLSHVAERVIVEMRSLYNNSEVAFSRGLESFAQELQEIQPTLFFAVPRLWAKFKEAVDAKVPAEVQAQFTEEQKQGVKAMLGFAKTKLLLTGSAPTPLDIQHWYRNLGINLREGYGMTENFCHGAFNWKEENKLGSVGYVVPDAEVKISDDGEICFKSDAVMQGYYLNPEKTAEVIRDGWYHTGDAGRIDDDGAVVITGRIGDVFKSSKGKFIVPNKLEEKLASISELGQLCVFGHGLDKPMLLTNLSEAGQAKSRDELNESLNSQLDQVNAELPAYEQIGGILVTPEEWSIENALLTPTMKLKRKAIESRFAGQDGDTAGKVVWQAA